MLTIFENAVGTIDEAGGVRIHGIDFGAGAYVVACEQQESNRIALAVKVPGRTCWSGVGQTTYYSPEIRIFVVEMLVKWKKFRIITHVMDIDLARYKDKDWRGRPVVRQIESIQS